MRDCPEATLEKIDWPGLDSQLSDIYRLDQHKDDELVRMDGFGERFWQRLWSAIQQSRNTTFERYVIAMDIPMIGNTASGVLARYSTVIWTSSGMPFMPVRLLAAPDFEIRCTIIFCRVVQQRRKFLYLEELQMMMMIQSRCAGCGKQHAGQSLAGKTIVVTGKVEPYTRDEMNSLIALAGGDCWQLGDP